MTKVDTLAQMFEPKPKMDLSISYYDDLSRISNSVLGYFFKSIEYYYKALNGEAIRIKGKFLDNGTMIHKYILEKEDFYNEYTLNATAEPSSANQKLFVDTLVSSLIDSPEKEEEALKTAYIASYVTAKLSEDKILANAVELYESYKPIVERRVAGDNRTTISPTDTTKLIAIEKNIRLLPTAVKLIYPEANENVEVYSEFYINWIHELTGLECKSLVDRLIIDKLSKKIYLVDLKTTASITEFKGSMLKFGYYRQLAFYKKAIEWYIENCREDLNLEEYSIESFIVAISTDQMTMNEIRVFKFEKEDYAAYETLIDNALEELAWHHTNNIFHQSRYSYENGYDLLNSKWEVE